MPVSPINSRNRKTEEYAGLFGKNIVLQCEVQQPCKKNYKMNELHINLKEAALYLIGLFNATGQAYSCSRTKIGKLLSILAFVYARRGIQIFDETIYKYDGCGTTIPELASFVYRDVYIKLNYEDMRSPVNIEIDSSNLEYNEEVLNLTVISDIRVVFNRFGAYTAFDLGKCINPIVNFENVTEDDVINLSVIEKLSINDFEYVTEDKELIEFLYGSVEINNAE